MFYGLCLCHFIRKEITDLTTYNLCYCSQRLNIRRAIHYLGNTPLCYAHLISHLDKRKTMGLNYTFYIHYLYV